MSDSELESLTRHLGHGVQTRRQNYRLSHAIQELTVISQLLIAVDSGCVSKWKGKQLTDISVDEFPDVPGDEDYMEDIEDRNEVVAESSNVDMVDGQRREVQEDLNMSTPEDVIQEVPKNQNIAESSNVDMVDGQRREVQEDQNMSTTEDAIQDVPKQLNSCTCTCLEAGATQFNKSRSTVLSPTIPHTEDSTYSHLKGSHNKKRWSRNTEAFLRKTFKSYLKGKKSSVHNSDMILAQSTCTELSTRTLAQIRTKLNNMKLGKSQ